jgi:hypothetical protein
MHNLCIGHFVIRAKLVDLIGLVILDLSSSVVMIIDAGHNQPLSHSIPTNQIKTPSIVPFRKKCVNGRNLVVRPSQG